MLIISPWPQALIFIISSCIGHLPRQSVNLEWTSSRPPAICPDYITHPHLEKISQSSLIDLILPPYGRRHSGPTLYLIPYSKLLLLSPSSLWEHRPPNQESVVFWGGYNINTSQHIQVSILCHCVKFIQTDHVSPSMSTPTITYTFLIHYLPPIISYRHPGPLPLLPPPPPTHRQRTRPLPPNRTPIGTMPPIRCD